MICCIAEFVLVHVDLNFNHYRCFFADLGKRETEHRVEGSISVVLCLLGLIFCFLAFKNDNRGKCFIVVAMAAMLGSCKYNIKSMPRNRKFPHMVYVPSRPRALFGARESEIMRCSRSDLCWKIIQQISRNMRFPATRYVRSAKAQTSPCKRAV